MMATRALIFLLLILAGAGVAQAAPIELVSPARQVTLLELYTSEGCSSCPPADRWLSGFTGDARLWREIVPVAFHVDYWNSLGWRDRFSDAGYSARQQNYYRHRYVKGVYTPGFLTNGREWRNGFGIHRLPPPATGAAGVLRAVIDTDSARVEFVPATPQPSSLVLNVAFLGFQQTSAVAGGENRGKQLVHDFVVLAFRQVAQSGGDTRHRWTLDGLSAMRPQQAGGIALWVTAGDDPTPLQATGGWLHP